MSELEFLRHEVRDAAAAILKSNNGIINCLAVVVLLLGLILWRVW